MRHRRISLPARLICALFLLLIYNHVCSAQSRNDAAAGARIFPERDATLNLDATRAWLLREMSRKEPRP